MLTANQIDVLRSHSEQLMDPIIDFLIEDIAKRVSEAGQLTSTAAYQFWRTQQLGMSQRQLKKEIAKRLKISQTEAEKLLTQAAEAGYNYDISRFPTSHAVPLSANSSLQQILDATVKQAQDDLLNMTQTIGFVGPDGNVRELTQAYQRACDFAFQKVSTGAQDYVSAIREATQNLAKKGIRTIDYESGVHTSMEAAVRRNIMGGLGLMQEQISEQNHDDLGCDGWEISAHGGCAPDHEPIQGRQYSDKEYKSLNGSLLRRIGTLNCGHAAFPIILGVNSPQYTDEELEEFRQQNEEGVTFDGKHYTLYEATQRQRKFERTIRKQKRRILVDESTCDKDKLQVDQIKLQRLKQEYARFSKGTGLPMQHARMEAAGFDWKKGKAAENVFESMSASAKEINKIFGADSLKNLQKAVNRSTIKLQNGFACFPDGDPLNDNSKNVTSLDGFFDVAMHGTPRSVFFRSDKNKMSARTLATVIRHSKEYAGQNIRLLCCNTGKQIGDAYCFAEELANALGVTVTAPNKALYIFPDGTLRVGRSGDGVFVNYKPNQRRRLK